MRDFEFTIKAQIKARGMERRIEVVFWFLSFSLEIRPSNGSLLPMKRVNGGESWRTTDTNRLRTSMRKTMFYIAKSGYCTSNSVEVSRKNCSAETFGVVNIRSNGARGNFLMGNWISRKSVEKFISGKFAILLNNRHHAGNVRWSGECDLSHAIKSTSFQHWEKNFWYS